MRKQAIVIAADNNRIIISLSIKCYLIYHPHPHQEYLDKDNQGKAAYGVQPVPFCSLGIVS